METNIFFLKGYHNNRETDIEVKYNHLNYSESAQYSDFNGSCGQQCVEFSNGVYYQVRRASDVMSVCEPKCKE